MFFLTGSDLESKRRPMCSSQLTCSMDRPIIAKHDGLAWRTHSHLALEMADCCVVHCVCTKTNGMVVLSAHMRILHSAPQKRSGIPWRQFVVWALGRILPGIARKMHDSLNSRRVLRENKNGSSWWEINPTFYLTRYFSEVVC